MIYSQLIDSDIHLPSFNTPMGLKKLNSIDTKQVNDFEIRVFESDPYEKAYILLENQPVAELMISTSGHDEEYLEVIGYIDANQKKMREALAQRKLITAKTSQELQAETCKAKQAHENRVHAHNQRELERIKKLAK